MELFLLLKFMINYLHFTCLCSTSFCPTPTTICEMPLCTPNHELSFAVQVQESFMPPSIVDFLEKASSRGENSRIVYQAHIVVSCLSLFIYTSYFYTSTLYLWLCTYCLLCFFFQKIFYCVLLVACLLESLKCIFLQ